MITNAVLKNNSAFQATKRICVTYNPTNKSDTLTSAGERHVSITAFLEPLKQSGPGGTFFEVMCGST